MIADTVHASIECSELLSAAQSDKENRCRRPFSRPLHTELN